MMAANGTRFGGWLLNTGDNKLEVTGDFDGDGRHEILIASPWGIAVLKQSGSALTQVMIAPNGTRFGGWLLNTADNRFDMVGDFNGDGRVEILVTSPWGIGILARSSGCRQRSQHRDVRPAASGRSEKRLLLGGKSKRVRSRQRSRVRRRGAAEQPSNPELESARPAVLDVPPHVRHGPTRAAPAPRVALADRGRARGAAPRLIGACRRLGRRRA